MKKVVYFLITIFFVGCSSSSTVDKNEKIRIEKQTTDEANLALETLDMETELEVKEDNLEKSRENIIDKNEAKKIKRDSENIESKKQLDLYRKIISDEYNYFFGEAEGDDLVTVKANATKELAHSIRVYLKTEDESTTGQTTIIDSLGNKIYGGKRTYKGTIVTKSDLILFDLKSIKMDPKYGSKHRIFVYMSKESLEKSHKSVEKEIGGLLKEAENTDVVYNNLYDAIPKYYRAYLKSQSAIYAIQYNSNNIGGPTSAKDFAEGKVRKYIEDIKINIASINYSESDEVFEITLKLIYQNKIINNIKVKTDNSSFRPVKNSTVKLYETFIDLSHCIINIDCQVSPFIEFAQSDFIKNIEEDFEITVTKTVEVDFSSFLSMDFDGKMENEKAFRFTPKLKFISPFEFSWEFSDGTKSSDERPLKILQPNFKDLTVTLKLNNDDNFTVIKKLQKDKKFITLKKADFTGKCKPVITENPPPPPAPLPDDNNPTPTGTTVSPPTIYKTNLEFENKLNTVTSGDEIEPILEDLKDKLFLRYSTNSRSFSNIEPCYLFVRDKSNTFHFLKPGTQIRLSLRGKEINMNDISKIFFYIILN